MTEAARLSVVVEARIGDLERGLSRAQAQLVATQRRMDATSTAMVRGSKRGSGAMAGMAGSAKMLAGAAGIGGLGLAMTKVVKTTAGFEKQMASTRSVSGATARQMSQLRQQAKSMGTALGIGATEAAQAQTELAKGGLSTAAILSGGFKSALTLAAAGELAMADAATYTVNAMKTFGIEGKNSTQVADALAMAANKTTADVSDFGMALTQGGAAARAAGYDFQGTMTILGALAEIGVKNSDAGTSMKAAMLQLVNPTKKQAEAAKDAGLQFLNQNGEMKSAVGISRMLRQQTEGMTRAQRTALFSTLAGTDGLRTLLALYQAGPTKLQGMEKAWQKQGYAVDVAKQKQQGLHGDLARLQANLESAAITLGEGLAPGLADGISAINTEIQKLSASGDLKSLGQDLGTVMGDMAATAPAAAAGIGAMADGMARLSESRESVRSISDGFSSAEDAARKMFAVMDQGLPAMKAIGLSPGKLLGDISGLESQVRKINKFDIKVPMTLTGKDNVIKGMRDVEAVRLKNKIQRVLGQNTDARSKVQQIQGMKLPQKLQRILGNNSDAISKIAAVQGYINSLHDKTVKISVIQSMTTVGKAVGKKVGGNASGRGPGWAQHSLVGEGLAGEWVGDSKTGQMAWVDRPTLMSLGPDAFVLPTEPRYRNNAARIAAELGLEGYAKGKKKKRKKNKVEQTDPTQRPANVGSGRPLAGLLPGQNLFDQTAAPEAPQFSAAEVALAQARAMGDLGSIQAASQRLLGDKTAAYQAAVASGDSDKIKEAADALKSAGDELRDAGAAIVQANLDRWDASLVAAKIATPKDVTDDIAALSGALGVASAAYNDAVGRGDIQQQIQFGNEVINLTSSIEDLKKSVDDSAERQKQQNELLKQQLDEARRLAAASGAAKDAIIKALVDAANRQLGGVLGQSLTTPSTAGRVAALR